MCLLDADIGIIMNSPGMVDKCRGLQLEVQDNGRISEVVEGGSGKRLYHMPNFNAIV